MLTSFSKGDWLQFREQSGTIHRGILYVKNYGKLSHECDITHCKSLQAILGIGLTDSMIVFVSKEMSAPDKKFKLPVSMDSNSDYEQKLRDSNLHQWLSSAGLCTKPWEAPKPIPKVVKKKFCKARNISTYPGGPRASAFTRLHPDHSATSLNETYPYNTELITEFEILEVLEVRSTDWDDWWHDHHRPSREHTWYRIKLDGSYENHRVGWIHDSRVDLYEKEV